MENVAMSFALRYSAQVSDLILVGPEAEGFPYSEHFVMAQVAFQKAKTQRNTRPGHILHLARHDVARDHLRKLLKASPQTISDGMPLPEKPVLPFVKNLRMPTLIVTGSADIADNQAVPGALVMAIPGAGRVVVPDTGRLLYLEKQEVFASLVTTFLERHQF